MALTALSRLAKTRGPGFTPRKSAQFAERAMFFRDKRTNIHFAALAAGPDRSDYVFVSPEGRHFFQFESQVEGYVSHLYLANSVRLSRSDTESFILDTTGLPHQMLRLLDSAGHMLAPNLFRTAPEGNEAILANAAFYVLPELLEAAQADTLHNVAQAAWDKIENFPHARKLGEGGGELHPGAKGKSVRQAGLRDGSQYHATKILRGFTKSQQERLQRYRALVNAMVEGADAETLSRMQLMAYASFGASPEFDTFIDHHTMNVLLGSTESAWDQMVQASLTSSEPEPELTVQA